MKNITLFSLSILVLASGTQPTLAMEGDNNNPNPNRPNVTVNIFIAPNNSQQINDLRTQQTVLAVRQTVNELGQSALQENVADLLENRRALTNNKIAYESAKAEAKDNGLSDGIAGGFISGIGFAGGLFGWSAAVESPDYAKTLMALGITSVIGKNLISNSLSGFLKRERYETIRRNPKLTPDQKTKIKKKYHENEFVANTITSAALLTGFYALVVQNNENPAMSFCKTLPVVLTGMAAVKWITYSSARGYKKWQRAQQAIAADRR